MTHTTISVNKFPALVKCFCSFPSRGPELQTIFNAVYTHFLKIHTLIFLTRGYLSLLLITWWENISRIFDIPALADFASGNLIKKRHTLSSGRLALILHFKNLLHVLWRFELKQCKQYYICILKLIILREERFPMKGNKPFITKTIAANGIGWRLDHVVSSDFSVLCSAVSVALTRSESSSLIKTLTKDSSLKRGVSQDWILIL